MRKIVITRLDLERLTRLIDELSAGSEDLHREIEAVLHELARAEIVEPEDVPRNVITMNSTVVLRDLDTNERHQYTLVYPKDADLAAGKISILAPIGAAIIGYRAGDIIEWNVPVGLKRYKVEHLLFQPERSERFDL